jgi:hypothetical protein
MEVMTDIRRWQKQALSFAFFGDFERYGDFSSMSIQYYAKCIRYRMKVVALLKWYAQEALRSSERRKDLQLLRLCDNKHVVLPQVVADRLHLTGGPLHIYMFDFRGVA